MALQNLQQYGCQTGKKSKEKSRDLNRNSSRNKNETMFGSGYENCPLKRQKWFKKNQSNKYLPK
jgi:hypothetical protein